jgi:hypothetical protein
MRSLGSHRHVGDLSSCGIVSIQRERPRVVLPVGAQGDLLEDASRMGRAPDTSGGVGKRGKMIQLVCVLSLFFQTPMQKSRPCGRRAEFTTSLPSLCQVTKELSGNPCDSWTRASFSVGTLLLELSTIVASNSNENWTRSSRSRNRVQS